MRTHVLNMLREEPCIWLKQNSGRRGRLGQLGEYGSITGRDIVSARSLVMERGAR